MTISLEQLVYLTKPPHGTSWSIQPECLAILLQFSPSRSRDQLGHSKMLLLPRTLSSRRALAILALAAAWLLEGLRVTSAFVHRLDKCEPIAIPRCRTMPYNMTRMPNLLHHRCVQVTPAELYVLPAASLVCTGDTC